MIASTTAAVAAFGALLVYMAFLQLDDPRPATTGSVYLLGGLAALYAAAHSRVKRDRPVVGALAAAGGAAAALFGKSLPATVASVARQGPAGVVRAEQGRDCAGMLIAAAGLVGVLRWRWQRGVRVSWTALGLAAGAIAALTLVALGDEEAPEHCLWQN